MRLVEPYDSASSYLYRVITGTAAAGRSPMPPPGATAGLTKADKDLVRCWIDSGAFPDCGYDPPTMKAEDSDLRAMFPNSHGVRRERSQAGGAHPRDQGRRGLARDRRVQARWRPRFLGHALLAVRRRASDGVPRSAAPRRGRVVRRRRARPARRALAVLLLPRRGRRAQGSSAPRAEHRRPAANRDAEVRALRGALRSVRGRAVAPGELPAPELAVHRRRRHPQEDSAPLTTS